MSIQCDFSTDTSNWNDKTSNNKLLEFFPLKSSICLDQEEFKIFEIEFEKLSKGKCNVWDLFSGFQFKGLKAPVFTLEVLLSSLVHTCLGPALHLVILTETHINMCMVHTETCLTALTCEHIFPYRELVINDHKLHADILSGSQDRRAGLWAIPSPASVCGGESGGAWWK